PPTRQQLGRAAATWAAVSLADKLDTIVGLFAAGERPTGSRDPFGLRRAAQGVIRTLVDLPRLVGTSDRKALGTLIEQAASALPQSTPESQRAAAEFLLDRFLFFAEQRGYSIGETRAVRRVFEANPADLQPLDAVHRLEALRATAGSEDFRALAELFKRVKNITKGVAAGPDYVDWPALKAFADQSKEPAERALVERLAAHDSELANKSDQGDY